MPIIFLVASAAAFALTGLTASDGGMSLGWGGLAAGFFTAGLVDLLGVLEARRRRAETEQLLAPIRATVRAHLQAQRRDLLDTVSTLFEVEGEPETWAAQLKDPELIVDGLAPARILPPRSKATRVAELRNSIWERQRHLEGLAAGGMRTAEVHALSELTLEGMWPATLNIVISRQALAATSDPMAPYAAHAMRGLAPGAAEMLDVLLALDID